MMPPSARTLSRASAGEPSGVTNPRQLPGRMAWWLPTGGHGALDRMGHPSIIDKVPAENG